MKLRVKRENYQIVIALSLCQLIISEDDSDVTDTSDVEDSELGIEDEDDTDVLEDPENYFATKDSSVKWKKMIGY